MGVEDYGSWLHPCAEWPDKQSLKQTLSKIGFVCETPSELLYQPFPGEEMLTFDDGKHIIEILIRDNQKEDQPLIGFISIRFAVCQPITVVDRFFEIIVQLLRRHNLSVKDCYGGGIYQEEYITDFKPKVLKQVQAMKERWQQMFGGDTEEPKIAVNQVWSYFKKKHPNW